MEKVNKNIILVGFTSSGKSSIGKYLAQRLLWKFFDIDHLVSERIGAHQDTFIEENGWTKFREEEYQAILESIPHDNSVIATGGGTLLGEKSRAWFKEHSIWLYLEVPLEKLYKRTQQRDDRPLAKGWSYEETQTKFSERLSCYEQAHFRVNASNPINNVAEDAFKVIATNVLSVPYEFWFRKEYESFIRDKKLTSFVRPGNRLAPNPKGTSVGTHARMRILEKPSTPSTLPELTDFTANAKVIRAEVKSIAELVSEDFEGASLDAASPALVQSHLQAIYGREFLPSELVTAFKVLYK